MTSPTRTHPHAPPDESAVDAVLRATVEQARKDGAALGPDHDLLWSEIGRSACGGKRFRSRMVLDVHAALDGDRPDAAAQVAAGFELLHTAFLIHDDLIDGDTVRRGRPNLAATMGRAALEAGLDAERADRWSQAAALLAGDLALGAAHRLFGSTGLPPDRHDQLLALIDETLRVTAAGELMDAALGLGLRDPDLEQVLRVAEAKTAMYSFRAPLRAGAVVAAAPGLQDELDAAGRLLGRAFQLVDDLLGVFGPEDRIGKSTLSDLREGKQTPLVLHARELPVWHELDGNLGRADLDPATAERLRVALARSPAPARVEQRARRDLAHVADRVRALPPRLAAVVDDLAGRVTGALDAIMIDIEEARCRAD